MACAATGGLCVGTGGVGVLGRWREGWVCRARWENVWLGQVCVCVCVRSCVFMCACGPCVRPECWH